MPKFNVDANILDDAGFARDSVSYSLEATGHADAADKACALYFKSWVGYKITQTEGQWTLGRHYVVDRDGKAVLSVLVTEAK